MGVSNKKRFIIYDRQLDMIDDGKKFAIPKICSFEKYEGFKYQPVQGYIDVVDPSSIHETI